MKWTSENDQGEEITYELRCEYEVCPDCRGHGTTYLGWPAREQPAFTEADMDREGPEFMDDYMSGRYDKTCPGCKGERVVSVPVDDGSEGYKAWVEDKIAEEEMRQEMEAERRAGC
jgi:hypothetical protein